MFIPLQIQYNYEDKEIKWNTVMLKLKISSWTHYFKNIYLLAQKQSKKDALMTMSTLGVQILVSNFIPH